MYGSKKQNHTVSKALNYSNKKKKSIWEKTQSTF